MIRSASETGVEKAPSLRCRTAFGRFQRHESRVDMLQHLGIVDAESPAVKSRVVKVEHAQVRRLARTHLAVSPRLEACCQLVAALGFEIECVKDEQLLLDVIDASKRPLGFSFAFHL